VESTACPMAPGRNWRRWGATRPCAKVSSWGPVIATLEIHMRVSAW